MVRNRPRLTKKASWNAEAMSAAIKAVTEDGKKLRETARVYSIPVMTLKDRIRSGNPEEARLGRKPVFSQDQENDIARQVLTLAKVFYGISPIELRRLVFEYAEINRIKHNFNTSSRLAGWDWLQGFLKRNPSISVRKPEATSINRISAFNKVEVTRFYENLKTVMDQKSFEASKIYNFDETGISTVQKPGRILGPKGTKQIGAVTSWERGKNITVCCAVSAAGTYIPPMLIYPRARLSPLLQKDGPVNAIYHCSKNGWINEELFVLWLDHFIAYSKPTKESPVLLVMDNHSTHTTLKAYNKCKDNITIVTIPPHTSHRLQPLDVTFYSSLKAAFGRECDSYLKSNPFSKITPYEIASLFNKAYSRVANIEKGISGFKSTGIFPLDTEKFSEEDFAVLAEKESQIVTVVEEEPSVMVQDPIPSTSRSSPTRPSTFRLKEQGVTCSDRKPQRHVTNANGEDAPLIPFSKISPIPEAKQSTSTTRTDSRRQHSKIFTLTPNKIALELDMLEKAQMKKCKTSKTETRKILKPKGQSKARKHNSKCFAPKLKNLKNKTSKCRRNIEFDSSKDDDPSIFKLSLCDDDDMDDIDPLAFVDPRAVSRTTADGNEVCLFCGEFGADRELWYRCVFCSGWIHAACSAAETAENFVCDFCKIK